jgi:hypothetical protein
MTTSEILEKRNQNGTITLENENAGWFAISRKGLHYIEFADEKIKYYQNENSWAKRIVTLINRGN